MSSFSPFDQMSNANAGLDQLRNSAITSASCNSSSSKVRVRARVKDRRRPIPTCLNVITLFVFPICRFGSCQLRNTLDFFVQISILSALVLAMVSRSTGLFRVSV